MAWTTPKTWGSLTTLTATDMNTHIRDNLNYLKGITDAIPFSGAQATRSTAQSIPNASDTNITFTTEAFDYGGWFTASNTKIIVPAGAIPSGFTTIGLMVVGVVRFATSTGAGSRYLRLRKNGTQFGSLGIGGIADIQDLTVVDFTTAIATDYIEVQVHQTLGSSLDVTSATLSVVRYGLVV